MQVTCEPVDASQLLRDILQSKEHYQAKHIDNNNSSTSSSNGSSRDIFHNGGDCNSEMISPLLHSKSSDMAYNDRDNDAEVDNDNDIDVTAENGSVGDESDIYDRSFDNSADNSKIGGAPGSDTSFTEGESKEAKRAHVENILTSMKQSPRADSADSTGSALKSHNSLAANGEIKRQKRKQPQPQQHDSAVMNADDANLQSQIDYMKGLKRKEGAGDDCGTGTDLEDNADDEDEADDDVREASLPTKRARVEHILSAMRSPMPADQEAMHTNGLSPSIDSSKKQKRKQTQPQQHENSTSSHREFVDFRRSAGGHHTFDNNKDDASSNSDDGGSDSAFVNTSSNSNINNISNNNSHRSIASSIITNSNIANGMISSSTPLSARVHPGMAQGMVGALAHDPLFSANLLRGLHDKEYQLPFHNGFDPHQIYRENLFRHGLFGVHHDLEPMAAAYRGLARAAPVQSESETAARAQHNISPADFSKITEALKSELNQVVIKTIDKVFNKVLSDKLKGNSNASSKDDKPQSNQNNNNNSSNNNNNNSNSHHHQQQPQPQSQHQQHPSQPPQVKVHSSPLLPPQFPLHPRPQQQQPTLLQQPQQHQQQQPQPQQHSPSQPQSQQERQQQQQQQHHSSSHATTEREALKETVNNSQVDKKPELIVPFSDHLHFLERYGNRHLQEKMSAFEPLHKPESDLITPHTGPTMPFHHHFPYYLPTQVLPPAFTGEPEQTEALPLIVNTPKKKRTKVTDTRLSSPRSKSAMLAGEIPCSSIEQAEHQRHLTAAFPHFMTPMLPTSVAITNPSLTPSDFLALRLREAAFGEPRLPSPQEQSRSSPHSPAMDSPHFMSKMDLYERVGLNMAGNDSMDSNGGHMLRKAKLMFFYTRYPSSAILKMYFPDVLFNKNNTAQLVKWFSNFREFFYIQMEKYARQAMAEGCQHSDDLTVTTDSELFRHLNLHYNRNNQLQVPENFHHAVEEALKEFFKAIQANKDTEPSWKKAIYKIIARMDETLPEFFKSVDWMGQLNDQ